MELLQGVRYSAERRLQRTLQLNSLAHSAADGGHRLQSQVEKSGVKVSLADVPMERHNTTETVMRATLGTLAMVSISAMADAPWLYQDGDAVKCMVDVQGDLQSEESSSAGVLSFAIFEDQVFLGISGESAFLEGKRDGAKERSVDFFNSVTGTTLTYQMGESISDLQLPLQWKDVLADEDSWSHDREKTHWMNNAYFRITGTPLALSLLEVTDETELAIKHKMTVRVGGWDSILRETKDVTTKFEFDHFRLSMAACEKVNQVETESGWKSLWGG